MPTASLRERFEHIVEDVNQITREVNISLDRYEAVSEYFQASDSRSIIERGALVAVLRRAADRAEEIMRDIPGPNQVSSDNAEEVIRVMRALFRFIDSCHAREETILACA